MKYKTPEELRQKLKRFSDRTNNSAELSASIARVARQAHVMVEWLQMSGDLEAENPQACGGLEFKIVIPMTSGERSLTISEVPLPLSLLNKVLAEITTYVVGAASGLEDSLQDADDLAARLKASGVMQYVAVNTAPQAGPKDSNDDKPN
jgi:hypothetical protein